MSKILDDIVNLEEIRKSNEGYNWLSTLKLHGIISGFLAIISIILFVGISIIEFLSFDYFIDPRFFLVISSILFIVSAELYISAISFDMVNISVDIKQSLKKACEEKKLDWDGFIMNHLAICKNKKRQAKIVNDVALILLFIAFVCIEPYEYGIFILFAGIGYLIWQLLKKKEET
ncbi:MAG: hypothetical protein ACFFDH_13915 [Promethearchaeota archaeon]